jgi:tetratricopeptide (TPR) repeat protein
MKRLTQKRLFAVLPAVLMGMAAMTIVLSGCGSSKSTPQLREAGEDAYRMGDYAASAEAYAEVVNRIPADIEANHQLGRALLAQGKPLQARRYLEIAYQRAWAHPSSDLAYDVAGDLAESMAQHGDQDQLFAFLEERKETTGESRDYVRWGNYAERLGDPDTAELAYQAAAGADGSQSVEPYLALANLYEQAGDSERAIIALRYAFGIDSTNEEVLERLSRYFTVIGPTLALPSDL